MLQGACARLADTHHTNISRSFKQQAGAAAPGVDRVCHHNITVHNNDGSSFRTRAQLRVGGPAGCVEVGRAGPAPNAQQPCLRDAGRRPALSWPSPSNAALPCPPHRSCTARQEINNTEARMKEYFLEGCALAAGLQVCWEW